MLFAGLGIIFVLVFFSNHKTENPKQNDVIIPPPSVPTTTSITSTSTIPVTPPTEQVHVLPYGNVTLKLNQLATFKNISLRPLSVEEDSRCPSDVQCIWAGRVRVKVQIISGRKTSASVLTLGEAFTTEGATITLADVLPYSNSKVKITDKDYRFVFNVVSQGVVKNPGTQEKCHVGGCSGQLCTDKPDAISTCIYDSKFACYKSATCERQSNGECGWTATAELSACLNNS